MQIETNNMKINRDTVYRKFNRHCAYCGCLLVGKFQIDHVIPKRNFRTDVANKYRVPLFLVHLTVDDVDHIDNLVPTCHSCNNYKDTYPLETFRHNILELKRQLNDNSSQYRISKRFGLIREVDIPVKFYFENFVK